MSFQREVNGSPVDNTNEGALFKSAQLAATERFGTFNHGPSGKVLSLYAAWDLESKEVSLTLLDSGEVVGSGVLRPVEGGQGANRVRYEGEVDGITVVGFLKRRNNGSSIIQIRPDRREEREPTGPLAEALAFRAQQQGAEQ